MDLKEIINTKLAKTSFKNYDLNKLLTVNTDTSKGDVSLPCFALAKELKKSPQAIAEDIKNSIDNTNLEKVEVVNGYVNFFIDKKMIIQKVCQEVFSQQDSFGATNLGKNQTVFFDYSSANLAKYMHIGHLKTTIIGDVLKKVYAFEGYKTVGINYIGDYGLPFGKMIVAYQKWGNKQDIIDREVAAIQDLYVRFNQEAGNDPSLTLEAQTVSKAIEDKDKKVLEIYKWFIDLSKKEVRRICSLLGVTFDSWRGESYYSDKMGPVVDELTNKGLLQESEGAQVVDLNPYGLGYCLIKRSDGGTLYATRDLAAAEDRYKTYKFTKGFYVTSVAQKLHFQQFFKCLELLGKKYAGGLKHIAYGQYSLPTGKISSRLGKQALIKDLYEATLTEAKRVLIEKGSKDKSLDKVAHKISVGALKFETVKNELIKDSVFDQSKALSFEGETSPYMQYTYARCCSILQKCKTDHPFAISPSELSDDISFSIIKTINKFTQVVKDVHDKYEPAILTQYLLDLCSLFNKFYNFTRVIENGKINESRAGLVQCVRTVLGNGLNLIGIPLINKM